MRKTYQKKGEFESNNCGQLSQNINNLGALNSSNSAIFK